MKRRMAGLSYVEVLVATLLIAVALVPMLDALQPGIQGSVIHRNQAEVQFVLRGAMERVLAEPFDVLDEEATNAGSPVAATVYSDLGAPVPHEVFIWRWDVDNADGDDVGLTGGEDDILWISVATQDGRTGLTTLLSRY